MQMNNYWEMGSSKGPIIALQFSYYHNTPIPYCHTLLLLILAHKNSYYWTLMCPIFAQKHLGSCKWNNNLEHKMCNLWVLVCMTKCNYRALSLSAMRYAMKFAIMWQMEIDELKLYWLVMSHRFSQTYHICIVQNIGFCGQHRIGDIYPISARNIILLKEYV